MSLLGNHFCLSPGFVSEPASSTISPLQAAEILNVSKEYVYGLMADKTLSSCEFSGQTLLDQNEVYLLDQQYRAEAEEAMTLLVQQTEEIMGPLV